MSLTMKNFDFTDTTDNNVSLITSSSPDQPTTNTDMGETSTTTTNDMGETTTTDAQRSTTARTTAGTVSTGTSTSEDPTASPIFSCSVFTKELETILHSTVSQY